MVSVVLILIGPFKDNNIFDIAYVKRKNIPLIASPECRKNLRKCRCGGIRFRNFLKICQNGLPTAKNLRGPGLDIPKYCVYLRTEIYV